MLEPRLTARFWVDAYLTRLRLHEIPAFIVAHGDDTAGVVIVKLSPLNGTATAYARAWDLSTGARAWTVLAQGAEPEVDAAIRRQRGYDPDLWVIEVEDRAWRHLLGDEGLA